jgi:transcriptional regulator with XRE-family HTH domain
MAATKKKPPAQPLSEINLGDRVRWLRSQCGMTIKDVALNGGLSVGSVSKIENNLLSPTYESLIKLAHGLRVDIAELFSDSKKSMPTGRLSVTKSGNGRLFRANNYEYEMLCTDLIGKKIIPLKARVKARSRHDFSALITHEGEEAVLVLSGRIYLHTEFYEPMLLEAGDIVYFDSKMGHACVTEGVEDAEVFWVCSDTRVISFLERTKKT